jgi:NAD+ diphosphatase
LSSLSSNKSSDQKPNQVHTFAGNPLDRGEVLRRDEDTILALAEDTESLFLPFHKLNVAMADEQNLAWTKRAELPLVEQTIFLGIHEGTARFAVNIVEPADPEAFSECRAVAAQLPIQDTGILAQARSQLDWHRRNQFCAECGQPSQPERGGQVRRCSGCSKHIFPRTDPVAIMLIVDRAGGERCLLGQSQGFMAQTKFFSALAGFLDQGESLEEAVRREVWEEAGLRVGHVQYHSSQPWPFPSQLMMGCHGIAETLDINIDEQEMADVRWFTRDEALGALNKENPELRVPGEMAIAHHLIRSWAEGEVTI